MTTGTIALAEQRMIKMLELLTACANEGRPAPSNPELAETLGLERPHSVCDMLQRLELRGDVSVQRFVNSRIVTITATGKSTAGKPGTVHWTRRKRALDTALRQRDGHEPAFGPAPTPVRTDRDPCPCCGVRRDIGCEHTRKARPLLFVPVSLHHEATNV